MSDLTHSTDSDEVVIETSESSEQNYTEVVPLLEANLDRRDETNRNHQQLRRQETGRLLHSVRELLHQIANEEEPTLIPDAENNIVQDENDPFGEENQLLRIIGDNRITLSNIEAIIRFIEGAFFLLLFILSFFFVFWKYIIYFIFLKWVPSVVYNTFLREVGYNRDIKTSKLLQLIVLTGLSLSLPFMTLDVWGWFLSALNTPKTEHSSFLDILLRVILMDSLTEGICLIVKLLISLVPISLCCTASIRKRRQFYSIAEHLFYTIRLFNNTVLWREYLKGSLNLLGVIYLIAKCRLVIQEMVRVFKMIRLTFRSSLLYGEYVSARTVQEESCSVCMDKLSSPVKLSCSHLFCEECISQWFEKEKTCPLCRKEIKQGTSWIHSNGSRITSLLWY